MPKLKTRKTLLKRIKVSKNGKLMKKQSRTGHLKVKWSTSRKFRKRLRLAQKNTGHIKTLKRLLGI
jgi:ribosomal protein L35